MFYNKYVTINNINKLVFHLLAFIIFINKYFNSVNSVTIDLYLYCYFYR